MTFRCCNLNRHGIRCPSKSSGLFMFHGDDEIHRTGWIAAPLCKKCAGEINARDYSEDAARADYKRKFKRKVVFREVVDAQ